MIYVNDSGGDDNWDGEYQTWISGTNNGPKKSIKNATGTVTNNGKINIANGLYQGENNTNITIKHNMTLTGESQTGSIINGSNSNWLFNITPGVSLTIKNLALVNGAAHGQTINDPNVGAAVLNHGNLTAENCTFAFNTAEAGGAIYNDGRMDDASGSIVCTINGCNFINNTATSDGGAIQSYCRVNDGSCSVTVILTSCNFTGNTANRAGAVSLEMGVGTDLGTLGSGMLNVSILGCNFSENIANMKSGAIYFDCTVNKGSGTFISNIEGCNFIKNKAKYIQGGAIATNFLSGSYLSHNAPTFFNNTITNSNFTNNTAGDIGGYSCGGAIATECGTYDPVSYLNNKIIDCNFLFNKAIAGIGGAIYNRAWSQVNISPLNISITGSNFINNSADIEGGAIYNHGGNCEVNFNRIVGNTAPTASAIQSKDVNGIITLMDATKNWWGSNNPDFNDLIRGVVDNKTRLYMAINATPKTINNTQTSLITVSFNHLFNGTTVTSLDPNTGHIPDGTPVTFNTDKGSIGCKTIDKETSGGIATATLTADETAGTAQVNGVCDNQAMYTDVTINAVSGLYLTVTPNNTKPKVGDTVLYILKVGNKGPDTAQNVVMTYIIPQGLEFAGAKVDVGNYTYDPNTRTLTWIIGDVPVGDPYMNLTLHISRVGQYTLNPVLSTSTNDPTINTSTQSITINAVQNNSNTNNTTTVNAKSTVSMQHTGIPLNYLIMAILLVIGGLVIPKRK